MGSNRFSRRVFLMGSAAAMAGCAVGRKSSLGRLGYKSPNEKLNVAAIGAGGKGASDIGFCEGENVIALCDPDWVRAAETFDQFPGAKKYRDFREMLDKEKSIDAVTVSTPDHVHAIATMMAMERGIHVYCQKPLTHTVEEARKITEAARKYKVATQMGNQGASSDGVRTLCEMIWSGVIGQVREAYVWTNRPIWPQGIFQPLPAEPVPDTIDWDVWLGPAPYRPYNHGYAPFNWRGWWDFGCGALGDMGCHNMNSAYLSLKLCAPTSVECVRQIGKNDETFPLRSIIRYEFPQRGTFAPVTLYWLDGGNMPPMPEGLDPATKLGDGDNGTLMIGEKGILTVGTHGEKPRLLPDKLMLDYKYPPKMLTRSPGDWEEGGHTIDWIRACKGGSPACSNFDISGPLTEIVVLGNIALRCEGPLHWDSKNLRFTNNNDANRFIGKTYRPGWTL